MRTLVVGDIHSGLRALQQVLDKVQPRNDDVFVFLGDYVDGWSDAAETVEFLINFSEKYQCVFIRGNHDYLVHRYLKHNDQNPMWLAHGGTASKLSYDRLSEGAIKEHLHFYEGLTNYHIDGKNRLYVHAGFTNVNGIQHEYFGNLVFWDRTLWELVCAMDTSVRPKDLNYPKRLTHYHEIYIGHTPVTRMGSDLPLQRANVWNIDTGAAFKGSLTILDVDTKEFWQSESVYKLYPDEDGRN